MRVHQEIKEGDYVYYPKSSNKLFKVVRNPAGNLAILLDNKHYLTVDIYGRLSIYDKTPSVYLATSENKDKLEAFYGITLEDIPVDKEVEKFSKALDELSNFYIKLYSSDGNFKPSDKMEELKSIKSNLIQMFKERGLSK